jgi:predicted permease
MSSAAPDTPRCRAPRLSRALLAVCLPRHDRRFALSDLDEELQQRAVRDGGMLARRWYRAQVAQSLPPLLRRRFFGRGFGPRRGDDAGWKGRSIMPDFFGDIRYAVRKLTQAPLVVLTTMLSLGLGIGLATTVFTVANAMLLRPSVGPAADIDRLTVLYTSQELGNANGASSFPDYLSMVDSVDELGDESAFEDLMAYRMGMMTLEDGEVPTRLMVEIVTGNYFDVLGVPVPLGRGFSPGETRIGAAQPVTVISHRLWRDRFGADPEVLGTVLQVDGVPFTVIGIAPEGLTGRMLSLEIDAWLPLGIPGGTYHATPTELADRDDREYGVMGRLRHAATIERAQTQMALLAESLHREYGPVWQDDLGQPRRITVLSERDARVPPDARVGLLGVAAVLLVITTMVLLIACSNVAGMFLARAGQRRREMAIRLALGASRRRLIGMLLAESLMLGLASGAIGVLLAVQAARSLEVMPFPLGLSLRFDFSLDYHVLIFAVFVSIATSVVFGLAPALEASKPGLVANLKTVTGASGRRPGRFSLRNLLVIAQVASSVVFLVSAGLLLRTIQVTSDMDIGIDPTGIASMTKFLPEGEYPGDAAADYFTRLEERLAAHPDVEEVHTTLTAEMSILASVYRLQVEVDGYESIDGGRAMIPYNAVTPGYMEMLGIRMLQGRTVNDDDRAGAPRVAVVNQALADLYWPGERVIGKSLRIVARRGARNRSETAPESVRVVGVAANGSYAGIEATDTPFVWMPIAQDRTPYRFIHVRARGGAQAGAELLRKEVPVEGREVSLIQPSAYEELIGFQYWVMEAASHAFGYLGAFALLLAAVGIYGIVSHAVSRRSHEMAVRRAVGAVPRQVVNLVLKDGVFLAGWGLAAGLVLVVPIAALLAGEFSELSPLDPLAVGGSVAVLSVVALIATLIPARRVTRIDPMNALRDE